MRDIPAHFREAIEASETSENALWLVAITHPDLETPIYVNSDIIDCVYGGNTYLGCAFAMQLLSDDDSPPTAEVTVQNVDRAIGNAVRVMSDSPQMSVVILAQSDFDNADPRQAIGTPSIVYQASHLFLRDVSCNPMQLTGNVGSYDVATEPYPAIRTTPDFTPALYR